MREDTAYDFYLDRYLSSSRLIFDSILDNYIIFNDLSIIEFNQDNIIKDVVKRINVKDSL